jgi:hypothetical protein
MQLFSTFGHENNKKTSGLNLINGEVEDLHQKGCKLQLPHIGWNEVNFLKNKEPLFEGVPNNSDFYFVHKFAFFSTNKANIIGTTNYDINFASVLKKNNILRVEKIEIKVLASNNDTARMPRIVTCVCSSKLFKCKKFSACATRSPGLSD